MQIIQFDSWFDVSDFYLMSLIKNTSIAQIWNYKPNFLSMDETQYWWPLQIKPLPIPREAAGKKKTLTQLYMRNSSSSCKLEIGYHEKLGCCYYITSQLHNTRSKMVVI